MRHWHPMSSEVVSRLEYYKPDEIILVPLYPQFSTTTTASSIEEFTKIKSKSLIKDIISKTICCYPQDDNFVKAHVSLIIDAIDKVKDKNNYRVLFSAHGLPKKIIVTDENRFNLLPKFAQKKAIVIPNVPNFFKHNVKNISNDYLTICYFGSLHKDRGTNFLENLMAHDDQLKVIAAGWINDDYTKSFIENPRVNYLGIRRQRDVNTILAKEGDYLLSIYPLKNTNNIYASPNKIYDAIQTKTPVIINKEILVSSLVEKLNIGYVIENFQCIDYGILINELKDKKKTYSFDDELIHEYTWEKYESKILNL